MNRASGSTCSRSPGQAEEAAEELEALGRPVELLGDLRQPGKRQEVGERAVGPLDRQPKHLAPQRREHDRHRLGRRLLELEAGRGALAGERGVAGSRACPRSSVSGFEKGIWFQPSTIRSEEAPIPSTNRPSLASARAAACWASSAGPRVNTPTTPVPSRARSVQAAASASGVKPSGPWVSPLQRSV